MKKLILRKRKDFPASIRPFKEVKGICVHKCIDPYYEIGSNNAGHAHQTGKYSGWICLNFKYHLKDKLVLLHEVAHLLVPEHAHSKKWRDMVVQIGGTIGPFTSRYSKAQYPGFKSGGQQYYL